MMNENLPQENNQLQDLQEQNDALQRQIDQYRQQEIVDAALWRARARNPIAVRALMDWMNAKPEELESMIIEIREKEPYLFYPENSDQPSLMGFSPTQGVDPQSDAFVTGFLNR